jgi:hypothetical protein
VVIMRSLSLWFVSSFALSLAACGAGDNSRSPSPSTDPSTTAHGEMVVDVEVDGVGSVRSEPAGIACPGNCRAVFAPGTKVTLVATLAEGWKIDGWSGASGASCSSSGGDRCEVVVDRPLTIKSKLALIDPPWDPSVGGKDCADAWGVDGDKLSPCDTTKDDYVVVHKSKRNVALCKNGALVKNIRGSLGFAPEGDKEQEGDGKTPEGVFYIPRLLPESQYYKAFLLSYPTAEDAKRGTESDLITANQRKQIESAQAACVEPPQSTKLGGELEIHGQNPKSKSLSKEPNKTDWTAGCVALANEDVDLLWKSLNVHDTIVVLP